MWRTIQINTKTGEIKDEHYKESYRLLGGRSLIAQFAMDEINPACDPLGPENKLIICTGLLAGTNFGTAHRLSIGGKSPLTGGIKESNVGGTAAYYLAGHGIKMIVFDDIPESNEFKLLFIDKKGKVSLLSANEFAGLNNYAINDLAREKYGKDVSVASIGVSGERKYHNAGITVTEAKTGHPCRVAARGAMGALMASKGIKAVIIEKPETRYVPEMADPEAFKEASVEMNKFMASIGDMAPPMKIGTVANIASTGPSGVLPVRNFSGGYFKDHEKLGPVVFMNNLAARGGSNKVACQPGCPLRCSNNYNDTDGKHITSGFEYETLALFGPNLDISDYDAIARMDRFCDDFGVDTIETACAIGVCMDAGKIPWGDINAVMGLLKQMEDGTEFGNLLGQGTEAVGLALGCKRIPTVKRQAMAAYEPRHLKGTGITYAISPMGADHTAGTTLGAKFDSTEKPVQAFLSRTMNTLSTMADSTMCLFGFLLGCAKRPDLLEKCLTSLYGEPFTFEDLSKIAIKNILTERAFNQLAGFTDADDKLPDFFYHERSPYTGATFDFSTEEMLAVYDFV